MLIHFPESKYIFQVRDPRDMALSWKKSPVHAGGVIHAARQWKKDQTNFLKNHCLLEQQGKSLLVKYEELISDAPRVLRDICRFLSIPYDPGMLNYHEDELTNINSGKQEAWANLSRSVMGDNKEKFRRELTDLEIRCIEKICCHEMMYFGYEPLSSAEDRADLTEDKMAELEREERNIARQITDGVRKNMEAKKVFYEKILD